jgi:hypothetical protein
MAGLTADDLAGTHEYLAENHPDWARSMASIRNEGGPWACSTCGGPSYLCYRCSACGANLAADTATHSR